MGMCSKCYREVEAQQVKQQAVVQAAAEVAAAVMPQAPKPVTASVAEIAPPPLKHINHDCDCEGNHDNDGGGES